MILSNQVLRPEPLLDWSSLIAQWLATLIASQPTWGLMVPDSSLYQKAGHFSRTYPVSDGPVGVGETKLVHDGLFTRLHDVRVFADLMIIARQVQHPMDNHVRPVMPR